MMNAAIAITMPSMARSAQCAVRFTGPRLGFVLPTFTWTEATLPTLAVALPSFACG